MRQWVTEEEEEEEEEGEEEEGEGEAPVATEDYSKLHGTKSHCASLRELLSVTHHLDISVLHCKCHSQRQSQ